MQFTVTITEHTKDNEPISERLKITVDTIDINGVFKAVNTPPRKPRIRTPKTAPAATV